MDTDHLDAPHRQQAFRRLVSIRGRDPETSPLDRNVLLGLLLIGFFLFTKKRFNLYKAMKENIWLLLLIGFMLVSVLWSDIPFVSFKRWVRELVAVFIVFLVLTERDPRQAVQSVLRRTIYICIPFSLLLIKYFPEYGVEYTRWTGEQMWVGVSTQKNGLGMLCMFAAFFLIWSFVNRWKKHGIPISKYHTIAEVFVLGITLWLLMEGGEGKTSATSNILLAVDWRLLSAFC